MWPYCRTRCGHGIRAGVECGTIGKVCKRDTYGVCVVCKQPISWARLEAVPWTHHCRECKEREHSVAYLHDPTFVQTAKEVHGAGCLGGQTRW
jgi:hypothetical protein